MSYGRPERSPPPPSMPFATGFARPERERSSMMQTMPSSESTATLASGPSSSKHPSSAAPSPGLSHMPVLPAQGPSTPQVQFSHPGHDGPSHSANGSGGFSGADFKRKRSLVRPDRERLDPGHRLFNYRTHAAAMEADGAGIVGISRTGANATQLRRGKSILAREENMAGEESGIAILKRGATLRRKSGKTGRTEEMREEERERKQKGVKPPVSLWMIYCRVLTFWAPAFLLKLFGMKTKERQSAWREKLGLLGIIMSLMAGVGFLTFGFTQSVCGRPPLRYQAGTIQGGSMIFHGYDYSMDRFEHPGVAGVGNGTNPLYSDWNAGGRDGSFLFQNVNGACKDLITLAPGSGIPQNPQTGDVGWYFPCNIFDQHGTSQINKTSYATGELCHTQQTARSQFAQAAWDPNGAIGMRREGQVYYTWDGIRNNSRNLGVYQQSVLDFSLLLWLDTSQVRYPAIFDQLARGNSSYRGQDITMQIVRDSQRQLADCLVETVRVGFVDSETIGCVASSVVLYVSLVFIIGVVAIKFALAVTFGWVLSWRLGSFRGETIEERRARAAEIEKWTDNIYSAAPKKYHPNVKQNRKSMLPTKSRFSVAPNQLKPPGGNRQSMYAGGAGGGPGHSYTRSNATSLYGGMGKPVAPGMRNSPPGSPGHSSSASLTGKDVSSRRSSVSLDTATGFSNCPFPLDNVVPQPAKDYEPFNFPLVHSICLVTAYSESTEGLRTTIDSLATTDYPNSHKLIMVICDGMVKGSGNTMTTPEICLSMMKDLVVAKEDVQAHSYVAIADGHKRHNMAKVYAGFYDYDNGTVESSKQQRVPMVLVAKVGNPLEAHDAKPGNRGKRDSQVLLMAFLQKVIFDERMTTMEYEFFNAIWRCTGVSPDQYEVCLMVDADTKVFPDSLTRMTACMVNDPEIMGLCGETKIANKSETWVTMIQVFEYYISHHLTKAFESMFGGVTCLPGCFSMYRIKAPKGYDSYWIPVLANPDIVEHYSENVVDTLHKKNLLLLGEDRYLTTLMLKTFPKRKMMFCPQAVCKTVVPDTFRILLSQRRRWINSTIHNLFELLFVRDLCGTFCFSMQFVVGMELAGTLVLPAAIAFTIYLLVITVIPGTEKPILPLILLAIILGLPGILIIVTSRRLQYVGWMLVYLLSLPIWNFILPAYAYLHMDDFSWGQTRKVLGEKKESGHGDKEGEFDSSHIVMKRWAEFERDRRWKANAQARENSYDVIYRTNSPGRSQRDRQSIISSAETYYSQPHGSSTTERLIIRDSSAPSLPQMGHLPPGMVDPETASSYHAGPRHSVPILEVPAPLAPSAGGTPPMGRSQAPSFETGHRSTPDLPQQDPNPFGDNEETLASPTLPGFVAPYQRNYSRYDVAEEEERQAMLPGRSPPMSPGSPDVPNTVAFGQAYSDEPDEIRVVGTGGSSSEGEGSRGRPMSVVDSMAGPTSQRQSRGVSLVDTGPVAGVGGALRTVQRTRRQSATSRRSDATAAIMQSPTSAPDAPLLPLSPPTASSAQQAGPSLPPGAAPPRP